MTLLLVFTADHLPLCCDATIWAVTWTLSIKVTLHCTKVYYLFTFTATNLTPSEVIVNVRYFSDPATPITILVRTVYFQSLYITIHLCIIKRIRLIASISFSCYKVLTLTNALTPAKQLSGTQRLQ